VRWAFLATLEEAKTLGKAAGWIPQILLVKDGDGRLVAAAPAYLKLHSQGEFVFDFAFADLAQRMGHRYFPKLLAGVPFTPATGRRLLTRAGEDRETLMIVLAAALLELAKETGASSVHVNFALDDEIKALADCGFVERNGIQYQWHRREAETFDDYLARFASKRRNQIKREVREIKDEEIRIDVLKDSALDDDDLIAIAFKLYKTTVEKFYWGHQYLNHAFFEIARRRMRGALELVLARSKSGEPLGGAINFAGERRLYGRYWGATREVRFLHFNVCYYEGIRECLAKKLDVFEPGAGGEHKLARGFEPTVTKSAHFFREPRLHGPIASYIAREREAVRVEREQMLEALGH